MALGHAQATVHSTGACREGYFLFVCLQAARDEETGLYTGIHHEKAVVPAVEEYSIPRQARKAKGGQTTVSVHE